MSQATVAIGSAAADSLVLASEEAIEDFLCLANAADEETAVLWNLPSTSKAKTRFNSYDQDSLNSPDSQFSNRSRVSSGEDDLETFNWRPLGSPAHAGDNDKTWGGLDETMKLVSCMPSLSSSTDQVTQTWYDPSLTELNAILEGSGNGLGHRGVQIYTPMAAIHLGGETTASSVEWTYLEPAQPYSSSLPLSGSTPVVNSTIEEITIPVTTATSG